MEINKSLVATPICQEGPFHLWAFLKIYSEPCIVIFRDEYVEKV